MKLILPMLLVSVLANIQEEAPNIVFLIKVEMVLVPLIFIGLAIVYFYYHGPFVPFKPVYTPAEVTFEYKPLIKLSEPEMEP